MPTKGASFGFFVRSCSKAGGRAHDLLSRPFRPHYFFTVFEHVADVDSVPSEMTVVLAPGGNVLHVLPSYAYADEPHCKGLTFPSTVFTNPVKSQMKRARCPTAFFDSMNLLMPRSLGRKLRRLVIPHQFVREHSYRATQPCQPNCAASTAINFII